jgi:hypothetical protein
MSDLVREVQDLLVEEARIATSSGWAEVRVEEEITGVTLHLEPVKLEAAPLEVHFDSDELLVCYPGRNNMVVEFFSDDPEEMTRQVRALARAIVDGSYRERLKEGSTEVEAEWPGPRGLQRASRKVVHVPGSEGFRWRGVAYEPY